MQGFAGSEEYSHGAYQRKTGVRINVVDRLARKQYAVEPRQYEGRLLHQLPALRTRIGDVYGLGLAVLRLKTS